MGLVVAAQVSINEISSLSLAQNAYDEAQNNKHSFASTSAAAVNISSWF